MAPIRIVFLGGNGHCAERLAAGRKALAGEGLELADVPYPGFEGRARAPDLDAFLRSVSAQLAAQPPRGQVSLVYATGIGGLIALCLRARGELLEVPVLLQAPVLWGLERRLMPRLMRGRLARAAAARAFFSRPFRRLFVRRHFVKTPSAEVQAAFFDGYARCGAFPDLFAWFTPGRLRQLERDLAAYPAALRNVAVWWGGRDRVVTPRELRWTEQALGTTWPLRVFPDWGHYPMIDAPEDWAQALGRYGQGPS
jgi:pimeloyl-ACP methyl ester carboxylesterase